jgi:hypothetical protein
MSEGRVRPYAGGGGEGTRDGSAFVAELAQPSGLALDRSGRLYFADSEASSIRWVDAEGVHTLVGSGESLFDFGDVDGVGQEARLQHPLGTAFLDGNLYIADTYNDKIKVIDPGSMQITTIAGEGEGWRDGDDPLFYEPGGLDAADGQLYIADTNNHAIRVLDLATNETTTLVLNGVEKFARNGEDDFFGTSITLDTMDIQEGPGNIKLDITFPEGFKLNEDAPSLLFLESQDGLTTFVEQSIDLTGAEFPLSFEVGFGPGTDTLTAELSLYYCENDKESLCFYEPVLFNIPVLIGSEGDDEIVLEYALPVPAILN